MRIRNLCALCIMTCAISLVGCGNDTNNNVTDANNETVEAVDKTEDSKNVDTGNGQQATVTPEVSKNAEGLYEYIVAGKYKVTCKTNIYDYMFTPKWYDGSVYNFIDMLKLGTDLGYTVAGSSATPDSSKATGFKRFENDKKIFGIALSYPNGNYFEQLFTDVYGDKSKGSGYDIHFVDDKHDNNYWVGSPNDKCSLSRSISFDQIVLLTRGMEESIAGNHECDWLYAAGFTKPAGYSHFYIYYK